MSSMRNILNGALALGLVAGGMALGRAAQAEEKSAQQIVDSLKVVKPRITRGLSPSDRPDLAVPAQPALSAADLSFIQRVRAQPRSLSSRDREQMATIVPKRPKIDLEINFEYNSAALSPEAMSQMNNLGRALSSPELTGSVIMLGGHTDAKGRENYNQQLSERRAETVKRFLVQNYQIPTANLVSAGYGKSGLKNTADPFAAENRRVEIVNMAEREQASR
jgi:outer membrane protein OmpA-like peptidoglycan-associated protein